MRKQRFTAESVSTGIVACKEKSSGGRPVARIVLALHLAGLLASLSGAQENQLSPDEAQAGYDLLFNGTELAGWHGYRSDTVPDAWIVATDQPLGPRLENRNARGLKQHILSDRKYTHFDLKIDVQTPSGGNSGVFVRYEETALSSESSRSGPEFQICGATHDDCKDPKHSFGACYDMFPVREDLRTTWYNPPGNWNQVRIIAYDSDYVHYGNGKKLLEYKIGTPEFLLAYEGSKYMSDGNYGRYYDIHPGSILLQDRSTRGQTYRNIKARELTEHPLREFPDGKWPDSLPQAFSFRNTPDRVTARNRTPNPAITMVSGGRTVAVQVPIPHADFHVLDIDGRSIPYRKAGPGAYIVDRHDRASGILILRFRAGGEPQTRLFSLP